MMKEQARCWAQVDMDAVRQNYRTLRGLLAPGEKYLAVVKANAYGHGALEVSRVLAEEGADWLGVATFEEALELRNGGLTLPVLILGYTPPEYAPELANRQITQGIFSEQYAKALENNAPKTGKPVEFHLMIDTGMRRLGLRPEQPGAAEEAAKICALPHLRCTGIFTHFAVADEVGTEAEKFTDGQFERFYSFCEKLAGAGIDLGLRHCCNSAGALCHPKMHLDMCRFGIVSYGLDPSKELAGRIPLAPVMSLFATVEAVGELAPGDSVSYGRQYIATEAKKTATVAIGYGDGYSRALGNRGRVLIGGEYAPVLGRVCMDQMMVDITHIPGVKQGDVATLVGRDGDNTLTFEELAEKGETIAYECTCAISARVKRVPTGKRALK